MTKKKIVTCTSCWHNLISRQFEHLLRPGGDHPDTRDEKSCNSNFLRRLIDVNSQIPSP